jgi:hypothetical protein
MAKGGKRKGGGGRNHRKREDDRVILEIVRKPSSHRQLRVDTYDANFIYHGLGVGPTAPAPCAAFWPLR